MDAEELDEEDEDDWDEENADAEETWEDDDDEWEDDAELVEEEQDEETWEEEDQSAQQQTPSSSSFAGQDRGTKRAWAEAREKQGRWTQEEWDEWQAAKRGKVAHGRSMPIKPWVKRRAGDHAAEEDEKEEEEEEEEEEAVHTNSWQGRKGKGKGRGQKGEKGKGEKGKGKKGKGKGKEKGRKRFHRNGPHPGDEEMPDKFGETWEEPRASTGLQLLGELAPRTTKWKYILRDESRRSFAGFLSNPFPKHLTQKWEAAVRDGTEWKQPMGSHGPVPRQTAWMVKKGCSCTYRYGGLEVEPQIYPNWMLELLRHAMPLCGLTDTKDWPDCCNMNLYSDGGMSVGWHSDDERLFQGNFQDIRIISLSFGQARRFELRLNWLEEGDRRLRHVQLGTGDLMTMEGMVQKHFQHRVPREEGVDGARINLTWRWIVKHNPKCPAGRRRN